MVVEVLEGQALRGKLAVKERSGIRCGICGSTNLPCFPMLLPDDLGLLQFVLRGHGHGRLIIILARSPWYLVIFPAGGEGTAWWLVSRTLFSSHIDGDKADGRPACHLL